MKVPILVKFTKMPMLTCQIGQNGQRFSFWHFRPFWLVPDIIRIRVIFDFRMQLVVRDAVLMNQIVVVQCPGLVPHEYNVLQIRRHKAFVLLQQVVQHFGSMQILHLRRVFGEYAQPVLGALLNDIAGKLEDQVPVIVAQILQVLDGALVAV